MLKSEHAVLLPQKEDRLLANMTTQLHNGHTEMKRQTVVAVYAAVSELKADIARVEGDRQLVEKVIDNISCIISLCNECSDSIEEQL